MELYGIPTTKELKKKHSSRLVGRWRGLPESQWHNCMQINQEEQLGSETAQPRVPARGNKVSKRLTENTLTVEAAVGENTASQEEFVGETHRVLEHTQTHPSGNQHQKVPV